MEIIFLLSGRPFHFNNMKILLNLIKNIRGLVKSFHILTRKCSFSSLTDMGSYNLLPSGPVSLKSL